jgi:hypothetical protein
VGASATACLACVPTWHEDFRKDLTHIDVPRTASAKLTYRRFLRAELKTAVRQLIRTQNYVSAWARRIYFSNTFLICPTFFSTLPAWCSALPSASKSGLFVT